MPGAGFDRGLDEGLHQFVADSLSTPRRVYEQVGDVCLVGDEHRTGKTSNDAVLVGRQVDPVLRGELVPEDTLGPREEACVASSATTVSRSSMVSGRMTMVLTPPPTGPPRAAWPS